MSQICWQMSVQPITGVIRVLALCGALSAGVAQAQSGVSTPTPAQILGPGQVVASGTVPDEATRQAVLTRLRELYGAQRVVDQLTLGSVVAPPQWREHVQKLLSPSLQQVSKGRLSIKGNTVDVQGEVSNEAVRQQVASDMASSLNPTYLVRNNLRVVTNDQAVLDQTLANRIIEFEPASAVIRPAGLLILDEMAEVLARMRERRFEVVGHTDAEGARAANVSLSMARAMAVKNYLAGKGIPPDHIATLGLGPDQPVASNATPEGRARNRRIEFKVKGSAG